MARLERVNEGAGGSRDYLAGEPVHCGDALEIWRDGQWRPCRYERTGGPHDFDSLAYYCEDRAWIIRDDDDLRWPGR